MRAEAEDGPIALLLKVFAKISRGSRRQFAVTIVVMIAGAVAELVTVGAVIPFLALVAGTPATPALAGVKATMEQAAAGLGISGPALATALVIGLVLLSAGLRLLVVWRSQRFAYTVGYELSTGLYTRLLHQPYPFHLTYNSGDLIVGFNAIQLVITRSLVPAMQTLVAAFVALFILAGMLMIAPLITFGAALWIGGLYALIAVATRSRLKMSSATVTRERKRHMLIVREGLAGIRDVILGARHRAFSQALEETEAVIRDKRVEEQFIATAPRFVVEAGGVIFIALACLILSGRPGGVMAMLPTLGAMAVAAQRLLPLVQQLYAGISSNLANAATLADVMRLLEIETPAADTSPASPPAPFAVGVSLHNVGFRYPTRDGDTLVDVSLDIPKGSRIGLVGETGSGKSTLVDILMGLLEPTRGEMRIDGKAVDGGRLAAWQAGVAYVPQMIALMDTSIAANIAFGIAPDQVDAARVDAVIRAAGLAAFVESLPQWLATIVGEDGIRLSGGQRQRIGIARALYKGGALLVLDEATSGLDEATEAAVLGAIAAMPDRWTVILISHRPSALADCSTILRLADGRVETLEP